MSNKYQRISKDVPIKVQLYVALLVLIMFSQLIAYIAYTLDPGALVLYQRNFWIRGIYGLILSVAVVTIVFLIPYKVVDFFLTVLGRLRYLLMGLTLIPLIYLLTPMAPARYGAKRWLMGIQVSDIAKFVALIFVIFSLEEIWQFWAKQGYSPSKGSVTERIFTIITVGIFISSIFLPHLFGLALSFTTMLLYVGIVIYIETKISGYTFTWMAVLFGLMYLLILFEPDISTSSLFALWFLFMLMLWYGRRGMEISLVVLSGIVLLAMLLRVVPLEGTIPHQFAHAIDRLIVWRDPFVDPNGISYHMVKNYLAVFKGGLWGSYPVNIAYVPPVPWSDAILPFTAVSMGTVFEILLVILWMAWGLFFLISGIRIRGVKGMFVSGFALWLLLQLIFNMLSTYDVFPPTGISVPFLSWGRTGLIIFTTMNSMAAVFIAEEFSKSTMKAIGGLKR